MPRGFQQIIMIEERRQKVITNHFFRFVFKTVHEIHLMQIRIFLATSDKRGCKRRFKNKLKKIMQTENVICQFFRIIYSTNSQVS